MLGQLQSPLIPVSTVSIPRDVYTNLVYPRVVVGGGGIHRPAETKCEQISEQFLPKNLMVLCVGKTLAII